MRESSFLPSIDDINFSEKIDEVKIEDIPEREIIKKAYKQFELDQRQKKGVSERTDSPIITFEFLKIAPISFFEKFESMTKSVTSKIIDSISRSEATIHISNHKNDPTNMELKEKILYIVMSEFSKIDRTDNEVKIINAVDKDILLALVINEIIGLGPLEPLWMERKITEIVCNGPHDVQVEIDGTMRRVPSVRFRDKDHLKSLIDKLYGSINKQLSPVNPRERGRLHDNSRMYAVHEVVAPQGPNFNIRKHAEKYWTPLDIINQGTASPELMHYIGNLIHSGISYLVVGGTGTGKTTLINALTGFYPENQRILTLEENLEMKPHPKKLFAAAMECLPAKAGSSEEFGVTMRDLVRSGLQMRPDIMLIGEVSDGAAYDLCQALNTGHSGGSTVHANDSVDAIGRISSLVSQEEFVRGPAVLDLIGSAFDIIIVVDRVDDGSRKIVEVVEIGRTPMRADNGELTLDIKPLWGFDLKTTSTEDGNESLEATWTQVDELSEYRRKKHRLDIKKKMSWDELLEISTYNVPEGERGGLS